MDTLDIFHTLVFLVPGFFVVWAWKLGEDKLKSDFEYLMFSFFWGVLLLAIIGHFENKEAFSELLQNPYASALVFSLVGIFISLIAKEIFNFITSKKEATS